MNFRKAVIGEAVIYQGDCLSILPTLDTVDHCITDPPYEETMHGLHASVKLRRTDGGPQRRELDFSSVRDIREPFLDEIRKLNRGWLLAFCNVEGVGEWRAGINSRGMKFKTTCIWNKPDATPKFNGQGPALAYECITTSWCGPGYSRWNGGGRRGVFTHCTNNPDRDGEHPTEKPLSLMRELVGLFSDPGQLILDPFMGSGSTGVACLQLGRRFIGIEQSEKYFDLACKRISLAYSQPRLNLQEMPVAKQSGLFDAEEETPQPTRENPSQV